MDRKPISRYPVPELGELPDDIRSAIVGVQMRPNDEFYGMGRG